MARTYEMTKRLKQVEETRQRITEAAVELHGTVGPAKTTVSAVAERAGVERLTVYRHFPDEQALFEACTGHWLEQNPPPNHGAWATIGEPAARLHTALGDLYAWYEATEQMMSNFFRDGPSVPALHGRLSEWEGYIQTAHGILARGWNVRGRKRALLVAAIGHALDFHAWSSLDRQGLDTEDARRLMVMLVRGTASQA